LVARNIISKPLKTQTFRNTQKLGEQKTVYKNWGSYIFLPELIQFSKGDGTLETRIRFNTIDNINGNVFELQKENGIKVSYIWGYNKTKHVAKIENIAYSSIPQSLITSIRNATDVTFQAGPVAGTRLSPWELNIIRELNALRNEPVLANAMITTFTYKPLIGVSTITNPTGIQTTYEYDDQSRLLFVKDINDNILSENQYHLKP